MKYRFLPLVGLLLLCLHASAQNVQYKINHSVAATTCTPQNISSDFGPRLLPSYDWHGGVDFSPESNDGDIVTGASS